MQEVTFPYLVYMGCLLNRKYTKQVLKNTCIRNQSRGLLLALHRGPLSYICKIGDVAKVPCVIAFLTNESLQGENHHFQLNN